MSNELVNNRFECDGEDLDSCLKAYTQHIAELISFLQDRSQIPDEIPVSDEDLKYLRADKDLSDLLWDINQLSIDIASDYLKKIKNDFPGYTPETKNHILEKQISSDTFNFYELDNFTEKTQQNSLQTNVELRKKIIIIILNYLDEIKFFDLSEIPQNSNINLQSLAEIMIENAPAKERVTKFIESGQKSGLTLMQIHNLARHFGKYISTIVNILVPNTSYFIDYYGNALTKVEASFRIVVTNLIVKLGLDIGPERKQSS